MNRRAIRREEESPRAGAPWLLVGVTARALAQAASRAGCQPCAIDGFADRDTRTACAGRALRLPMQGLAPDWSHLDESIAEMRRRHAPAGFAGAVIGSGLEGCPQLLDIVGDHAPLANCGREAVLAAATPARWFALLEEAGAPHPETRLDGAPRGGGWLLKRGGGTGGMQVRPWRPGMARGAGDYFQRIASGRPASALFLAAGGEARIVGWQRLLLSPTEALPWRYGGIACDDALPARAKASIAAIVDLLARRLPLRGLAGLDFLVDGEAVQVLELNPRPTASLALYPGLDLFQLHREACAGRLPALPLARGWRPCGEAVLYANGALAVPADFRWPSNCADLPDGTADFAPGEPVCSVRTSADSTRALLGRLELRLRRLARCLAPCRIDPDTNKERHERQPERQRAGRAAGRLAVC
ncbi:MAG TPA: ATP-grasp domain-containing protein [Candidatus Desulfobacillus sp.]|nr:ATP-grasp domain-containing protein [Candidatus Desulfobacillus sp.]